MKNLLALSLLLPSLAYAATVKFSEELIPLQVNENKVEHSLFSSVDEVTVSQGQHKIKVKYKDLYEIDYDEHEVIESEPFWLVINIENSEATYLLSMPRADDIDGAKQYIKNPFATFKEYGANNQALRLEPVSEQMATSSDIENKVHMSATTAVASTPASRAAPMSSPEVKSSAEKSPSAPVSQQPSALSMLEFWWSQASESEKSAFLANKKGS